MPVVSRRGRSVRSPRRPCAVAAEGRAGHRSAGAGQGRLLATTEEAHGQPDEAADQRDLQQQSQDGCEPRKAAEEAVAEQHAEETGAEKAGEQTRAEAEARSRRLRLRRRAGTLDVGRRLRRLRALHRLGRIGRRARDGRGVIGAPAARTEAAAAARPRLGDVGGHERKHSDEPDESAVAA